MLSERKLTKYEREHLKNPYFLEGYFQKRLVWLGTLILLAPLVTWGTYTAILDLFKIVDDSDFGFYQDILTLVGLTVAIPFIIQEYKFYNKHIWSGKNSKTRIKR